MPLLFLATTALTAAQQNKSITDALGTIDLDGVNESIGGHARRLALEYAPHNGQLVQEIANANSEILHFDQDDSSAHHRSGAIKLTDQEMYKAIFQGKKIADMRASLVRLFETYYDAHDSWPQHVKDFYFQTAVKNISTTSGTNSTNIINPAFESGEAPATEALSEKTGLSKNELLVAAGLVLVGLTIFAKHGR